MHQCVLLILFNYRLVVYNVIYIVFTFSPLLEMYVIYLFFFKYSFDILLLKDDPPSCKVIKTLRINVSFSIQRGPVNLLSFIKIESFITNLNTTGM